MTPADGGTPWYGSPWLISDAELLALKAEYPELRPSECPTCRDEGTFLWKGQQQNCDCIQQKNLMLAYLRAGIGQNYHRLSWDDLVIPEDQYAEVTDYLDHADRYIAQGLGLLLWGPTGGGKSLLAALVLKTLVKLGYDCRWEVFSEVIESFTAGWYSDQQKQQFATRFMRSRILGIDDLGKERQSSLRVPQTTFDLILRKRVENLRPTILTTNLNSKELESLYGKAILSLLVEQSIEVHIPGLGQDYRASRHDQKRSFARYTDEIRPIV